MVICDICEKSFTIKKSKKQHYKLIWEEYCHICDECRELSAYVCDKCQRNISKL